MDEAYPQVCRDDAGTATARSAPGRDRPALCDGGEYPDTMPQAIKLIDAKGRSCIYVPITQDGKVVDSQGSSFDPEDVT